MPTNLILEHFLEFLRFPKNSLFFGDTAWNKDCDLRLEQWVDMFWVPNINCQIINQSREQGKKLWICFLNWKKEQSISVDYRNIDPNILLKFENVLSTKGWSPSAIYLLEHVLILIMQWLYKNQVLSFPGKGMDMPFFGKYQKSISYKEFRLIHNYLKQHGNDFEVCILDLMLLNRKVGSKVFSLLGSDIHFKEERAYFQISLFEQNTFDYPCPQGISQRLIKLLRSRNILANEIIFGDKKLIKAYQKRLKEAFLSQGIATFCINSLPEYLFQFLDILMRLNLKFENFKGCLFNDSNGNSDLDLHLGLLDEIYDKLISDTDFKDLPYIPHYLINNRYN
jgi:hypothetical protein